MYDIEALKQEQIKENSVIKDLNQNGVLTITLNRQSRLNSLQIGMYALITNFLDEANKNPQIKVVILKGKGKHFCAGNDLQNFDTITNDKENQKKSSIFISQNILIPFCQAFINLNKPLIAVVQGACIGVAFNLLALCDEVYITSDSFFQAPLVKLAQGPEMCSSYFFPKIFGYQQAFEIIVGAKKLSSSDLEKFKMVNGVFNTYQEALDVSNRRATQICDQDQESVIEAKKLMRLDRDILNKTNIDENLNLQIRWSSDKLIPTIMKFYCGKSRL
ncbi:peroxisomal trans-enoyl isomerase, putative [Ichthyophthirius multifiliis]|uniref:Peroxisomal trans-enoyl isomerase, putative n=1 Tax=Ichthyophthirius multifiliis TaxID=5932 RepID=G0QPY3_ICHMU|nr:peroxisomal trans-enoyl isomerase, putative [Ichthyophthirius multifiliis]EGR32724.1 peroxisomal trans-enoyl isomerase, putative [Ichthyophthirius multifiliis]|eukprot:XP_004036710.1 peroxisomal trans-enoyl isomerase, putative [Ichthyophthirius multifiliis]